MIKRIFRKILVTTNLKFPAYIADHVYLRRECNPQHLQLKWQPLYRCDHRLLDAGAVQVGDKLYIFGGFDYFGEVLRKVLVFNLAKKAWTAEYDLPEEMAESHLGMIFDGQRYIYAVSGQKGNRCRPPTNLCFVFDTFNNTWNDFPALPEARYAPKVQLWQGRLHVLSGSKEDRNTPSVDYWSIAVKDGKAIENEWAKEIDAPRGGPHGATAVLNNKLYSFGGQEGDYIAIPGDPEFRCTGRLTDEKVYSDVYCLESGDKHWTRLADMPIPTSHTEFSIIVHGDKVLICGGTEYKNPETKELYLTDAIQCYDVPTDTWSILGRMPYRVKSVGVAYYKEFLYITLGQSDRDKDDARPGNYDNRTWRSKIFF